MGKLDMTLRNRGKNLMAAVPHASHSMSWGAMP